MKKLVGIVLLSVLIYNTDAEICKIHGNAGTYAGETLRLYTYSDYITLTKKMIAESSVNDEGYFSFSVETDESFEAFLDLDVFIGYIVVEPGKNFNIVLPKKTVRHHQDIMNPYFKPYEFYVRILNDDKTATAAMKIFDALYEKAQKKIFKNPKHINPGLTEKKIQEIDDSTHFCNNQFFKDYKKYKFLDLRYQAIYKNKRAIIRKDFNPNPVLFNNPAYNKLLKDDLGSVLFEAYSDTLYKLLGMNSGWNMINRTFANYDLCNNAEFREYYLFINLYREFYKNTIYKNSIIDALYSAKKYVENQNTLNAINNFLDNSSNLIAGNASLDFRLPDNDTYIRSLSDYRGKFVYLGFFSTESYACKKDILLLKAQAEKKDKLLQIILVFKEKNTDKIKKFLKDIDTKNMIILHSDDGGKIIEEYNVYVFPTYFLINPEGRLSLISAPGPSEDFESTYFKIKQERKIKQMRKKNN